MDPQTLKIVCSAAGTCGDLVTALIDSAGTRFNWPLKTVVHLPERCRLEKPTQFANDTEKDHYVGTVSQKYFSISSHNIDYHVRRQHDFIGITVNDSKVALQAADRFRRCHRPHVWKEMQRQCGAKSVEDYAQILIDFSNRIVMHTDKIVKLEDIHDGSVIPALENILGHNLEKNKLNFYRNWLDLQRNTFII